MPDRPKRGVLYVIACGSPRTRRLTELVIVAQAAGWTVCVIATPAGLEFADVPLLEELTGYPVRYDYWQPESGVAHPPASAMIVCPATFNTINKWAAGISDTLALGLLTEATGQGVPVVAAPALNSAQEAHPAFARSVDELRAMGITVLYGPGVYEPGPPGTGGRPYHWDLPLRALDAKLRQ
jgi:phosphopantothenoylcysteine synthetase/decarboxylase